VDGLNAVHGTTVRFPVTVSRQDGPARVTALRVEASFDDGRTWHAVRPDRAGSGWLATVHQPRSGFATLRATATDSDGNTVTETITRAYRIA
jgi:hypothetical protein